MLLPNKRLLKFEPHSFPDLSQSQLWFYFLEMLRTKVSFHKLSNHSLHSNISCVVSRCIAPRKPLVVSSCTCTLHIAFVLNKTYLKLIWFDYLTRVRIEFDVHLKLYLCFLTCSSDIFLEMCLLKYNIWSSSTLLHVTGLMNNAHTLITIN